MPELARSCVVMVLIVDISADVTELPEACTVVPLGAMSSGASAAECFSAVAVAFVPSAESGV